MYVTHDEIIKIIQRFGYLISDAGLCYGISLVTDIAIVLGETKEFMARLELMSSLLGESKLEREKNLENNVIAIAVDKAKQDVKKISTELKEAGLSPSKKQYLENQLEYCKKIIEIEAFCQNISLVFFPEEYQIYEKKIGMMDKQTKEVADDLCSRICPQTLMDHGGIATVFTDKLAQLGPNKISKINGYFWILSKIFKEIKEADKKSEYSSGIAISIGGKSHRISATFTDDDQLLIFDSNSFPEKMINLDDVGRILMGEGKPIFEERSSLFGDSNLGTSTLDIRIKAPKDKSLFIENIFKKHAEEFNYFKEGWLPAHYAAYSGDLEIVFKLHENNSNFFIPDKQGNTALSIALKKNHWNVVVHALMGMTESKSIPAELLEHLILHREKLKNVFLEFLATQSSIMKKEELLSPVLSKANALGQILISDNPDSISFEMMNKANTSANMRLFGKPKDNPSEKLQLLVRQCRNTLDKTNLFFIDHLYSKNEMKVILDIITTGLFSENKSEMESNAIEICKAITLIDDQLENKIINENIVNALGLDPSVQKCLKSKGLQEAIYMNSIKLLAGIDAEMKEDKHRIKKESDYSVTLVKIIAFYSKPACLQKILNIISDANNNPEMQMEAQHACASLNKLYKFNSKIRESFKKVWSDHPEAIDYINKGYELHRIISFLNRKKLRNQGKSL